MSRRHSIYVSKRREADSPPSPNATVAAVTVEIRVFYPPGQLAAARDVLDEAYLDAQRQVEQQRQGLEIQLPVDRQQAAAPGYWDEFERRNTGPVSWEDEDDDDDQ